MLQVLAHATTINGAIIKGFNYKLGIVSWGDSLTGGNQDGTGNTYPKYLSQLTGDAVFNYGIGGQTSTQIASRQTVSGDTQNFTIIWAGANNISPASVVETDIASMISTLKSGTPFLVLANINGNRPADWNTGGEYSAFITLNTYYASTYPNNYIDVRSYLISNSSASAEDVIDVGHDVIPTSLRALDNPGTITQAITTTSQQDFTTSSSGTNYTIYIGSEAIYVLTATGTEVNTCIRGYAGTTASTYSNGTAYTERDPLHLNGAGYKLVAQDIYSWMQSNGVN